MTASCTLSSSHFTLVKLTCDCSANASASLSSDVISSTLFHSSPSAPTSCCFCIPHACIHFFSSMLLASVHHPDFMAHDVSASESRNLDWKLFLWISPPDLFRALDRFHCRHRAAGKFRWLASGKEPVFFSKDMSMATWVLLHIASPSLAPSWRVLGIHDNSTQVCVPSNPVLSVTSMSIPL